MSDKKESMKSELQFEQFNNVQSADELGLLVQAIHTCVMSAFGKDDFDLEDTKRHLWR